MILRGQVISADFDSTAMVRMIDYGWIEQVPFGELRPLKNMYAVDPPLAVECRAPSLRALTSEEMMMLHWMMPTEFAKGTGHGPYDVKVLNVFYEHAGRTVCLTKELAEAEEQPDDMCCSVELSSEGVSLADQVTQFTLDYQRSVVPVKAEAGSEGRS